MEKLPQVTSVTSSFTTHSSGPQTNRFFTVSQPDRMLTGRRRNRKVSKRWAEQMFAEGDTDKTYSKRWANNVSIIEWTSKHFTEKDSETQ